MTREFGIITSIADNVIIASGLEYAFVGEVVSFETSAYLNSTSKTLDSIDLPKALVMNLEEKIVRLALFQGPIASVYVGQKMYRTYKGVKTVAGLCLLGSIVNPLGELIDTDKSVSEFAKSKLLSFSYTTLFKKPADIISRDTVAIPFLTGIIAIDCFLPIGYGQRQLIIGDLNSGKTSLAITMILNQRFIINNVDRVWRLLEKEFSLSRKITRFTPCLYLLIGKRRSEVIRIQNVLLRCNAFHFTCVIYAGCDMRASLLYLAPYAVTAMGEWFMTKGYHAIMVFDDLSEHAIAYRQVSLLLRRPPGREAFPGDIFFLHSKLLERAAQLTKTLGGGSLTCLPIIETKLGDISAYIPTNVISITDGQIFLSKQLANKAVRPAIYLDLSVSRVGSKAQYTSMKEVANMIKKDYRLFKDYETMSKIGDVDSRYAAYVNRGLLIKALLNQKLYQSTSFFKEVLSLYAVTKGFIDGMNLDYVELFFGLLFNGNFSHIYLNNKTEYNLFVHFEKQLLLESLLMVVPISAVEPEFSALFDLYMDFFNSELLPKIVVDVNKFYTRRLTLLSTAERTIID